jgi:hypothetical protein
MFNGGEDVEVRECGENEKENNGFYGRGCSMNRNWAN